jgi:hypothetical protein
MKERRWMLGVAAAALLAACSYSPKPIPVAGGADDLSLLAGRWSGEYHSTVGGRRGTIHFNLSAGADSATGEVLMLPSQNTPGPDPQSRGEAAARHMPQSLNISFVRAAQGTVSGRLDPYPDPECGCQVFTIFEGRLQGDAIHGTYVAHRAGNPSISGSWKVTRKR